MEVLTDFFWKFLQLFLNAMVPPLAVALAVFVVALAKKLLDKLTASINLDVMAAMQEAVTSAVLAAEQVGLKDFVLDKYKYAMEMAANLLAYKKIKFELEELSGLIEAAVMDEFNRPRAEELRVSDLSEFSEAIVSDDAPPSAAEIATAVVDELQRVAVIE